jgi:hypothetical protein
MITPNFSVGENVQLHDCSFLFILDYLVISSIMYLLKFIFHYSHYIIQSSYLDQTAAAAPLKECADDCTAFGTQSLPIRVESFGIDSPL